MKHSVRHSITRRRLLQSATIGTGAATALAVVPRPLTAMLRKQRSEPIPPIQDERIKELVARGLDAAKDAGAQYSDVRLTYTRQRRYVGDYHVVVGEREAIHLSIRALIDGYWGFSASPVWTPNEVVRLAREAVRQAKANSLGKVREISMPPSSPVRDGHWETPVELDPFELDPVDISDYLAFVGQQLRLQLAPFYNDGLIANGKGGAVLSVWQQSKAYGSTEGTYCTQRILRTSAFASLGDPSKGVRGSTGDLMTPTGAGWEHFRNQPRVIETVMDDVAYNFEVQRLPFKPVDVGRYTTVFDAKSVAALLSASLGAATHVDRAFGYLANEVGTSYLTQPDEMLGAFSIGHPSLTITANRNEPGGLATCRWDDEGVEPTPFTMIERGVVTDFHTSREGAGWLKPRYDELGHPFRSNGSAFADTANDPIGIGTANLVMQPAQHTISHRDLEASIDRGLSIVGLVPQMDFQLTSGFDNRLACFEIVKGKRVARIGGAGIMFRTSELWKSLLEIGGQGSQQRFGLNTEGDGGWRGLNDHSVTAVPVVVKDITIVDPQRR